MYYKFACTKCKAPSKEIEISISEYDELKTKQKCEKCGAPMRRVVEWNGIAEGSGAGWYGKSNGSNVI